MYLYAKCLNHLNITWAVAVIAVNVIVAIFAIPGSVAGVIGLMTLWPVSFWVLQNKNRGGYWILLAWLGSPLWLRNKTGQLEN